MKGDGASVRLAAGGSSCIGHQAARCRIQTSTASNTHTLPHSTHTHPPVVSKLPLVRGQVGGARGQCVRRPHAPVHQHQVACGSEVGRVGLDGGQLDGVVWEGGISSSGHKSETHSSSL